MEAVNNRYLIASAFVIPVVISYIYAIIKPKLKNYPPGPLPLPFIGHIHILPLFPWQKLLKMSYKYGGVIGLQLGSVNTIVISDPKLVKETLIQKGEIYSSRKHSEMFSLALRNNNDIVVHPYDERWRLLRKIAHQQLFLKSKLQAREGLIYGEVNQLLKLIHDESVSGKQIEPGNEIKRTAMNVIFQMCFSKRFESTSNEQFKKFVESCNRFFELAFFNPPEFLPSLNVFPNPVLSKLKQACQVRDKILLEWVEEARNKNVTEETAKNFLEALVAVSEAEKLTNDEILGVIIDMFFAGTDTTSAGLKWLLPFAVLYPEAQKKIQAEIDSVVGRDRLVNLDDQKNLPYTVAFIKEVMRMKPPAPLSVPHMVTEDDTLNGYTIPKGTYVFYNIYALGNNPQYWENANEFQPERFLKEEIEWNDMKHFKFLPFGTGKRVCVGLPLGVADLFMLTSRLLQCFEWSANGKFKIEETTGLTLHPGKYSLNAKPRFSDEKLRQLYY